MTSALGLEAGDVARLSRSEKRALVAWTLSKAGGSPGELFVPAAVRRLSIEDRLALAIDASRDAAWEVRERRRVVESPVYFVEGYGHFQPPTGPPIPMELWPLVEAAAEASIGARTQAEVLEVLWRNKRTLMLKARQLGMTWLVLHYAYWVLAFRADTPRARVLALSKHGGDASKLLERARRIRELLPAFLRHEEDRETRGSKTELQLEGRGRIVSLAGDPAAARMETATLAIVDEAGFIRNGQAGATLTALQPTIGEDGQEIVLSTGNGRSGDGEAFAEEVEKALRGEGERYFVFLPASTDPRRTEAWRDKERDSYRTDEDFEQENPEDVEQALGGEGVVKVFPAKHLAAVEAIGRAIAEREDGDYEAEILRAEGAEWGIDWGDFQTFAVYGAGLPGGGILISDELVQMHVEPLEASEAILDHDIAGLGPLPKVRSSADLAPPGTNRTFSRALGARRGARGAGRWPETHIKVPFGVYKEGGGSGKRGVNTVGYLRRLARRAYEFTQRDGWQERLEEASGLLAIAPRCNTLRKQMGALERDPKTAKVKKAVPDPKHPDRGDHGPDALVAFAHRRAERWEMSAPTESEQEAT